jgi:probable addiction module antidote protein
MDTTESAQQSRDDLISRLSRDREFTATYVAAALNDVNEPERRTAGLIALRTVAEAYGGLGAVARAGRVSRASVYRALSAKGNPRLTTLIELLRTVGLRLSIEVETKISSELERPVRGRPGRRAAKQDAC